MFSIASLFNPKGCKGEIYVGRHGLAEGEITQSNGRISLEFDVLVKLKDAKIGFPRYIANHLSGYELNMNGNNDFYLTLHFKSGNHDRFVRCFRHSLGEEVRTASPSTTVHTGNEGSPTWCSGLEELNRVLEYLSRPATQSNVLTRANTLYVQKSFQPA